MTDLFQRLRARSEILHQQLWARYAVFRLELHQRTTVAQRRIGAVALILLLVVIVGLWIRGRGTTAPHAAVPLPVVAATAETGDMPITYTALGTVTPLASVTVKSQINGYLAQIEFREGQEVNAGDALAEIDPRPYQAALEQAQGQLQRDQAQLEGARVDLARYRTLLAQDSIAKQTYDDQVATVHQLEGTVQLDQGIVANAKVNLAYCHITAPVAGRLGLRQVDAGNYVTASDANGIVMLNQMKPISVLFSLPEDDLPSIVKQTRAGNTLAAAAFGRTGVTQLASGQLLTIDNNIDVTTGTFKLRAQFANDDEILYPSQFVNVQLTVDVIHNVVIIPVSAIQRGSPGTYVYLVKADNTVAAQPVTLGPTQGERVAVTAGLKVGDPIVVDGADKLKAGAKVTVRQTTGSNGGTAAPASAPPAGNSPTDNSQSGGQRRSRSSP
ncbi:MAG TPA: MdtA/MuxA family multidrug efflux RND transporter periplasmic adaptor subunit [Stellaceae bacterium]|nr:MdtA/MuxA family multidrug efflux RND transporter periplasmic adaptor subunit [Stellaceae bacterium]